MLRHRPRPTTTSGLDLLVRDIGVARIFVGERQGPKDFRPLIETNSRTPDQHALPNIRVTINGAGVACLRPARGQRQESFRLSYGASNRPRAGADCDWDRQRTNNYSYPQMCSRTDRSLPTVFPAALAEDVGLEIMVPSFLRRPDVARRRNTAGGNRLVTPDTTGRRPSMIC